jgi:hypothetical protein
MDKIVAKKFDKTHWMLWLHFSNGKFHVLRTSNGGQTFSDIQKQVMVRMYWERGYTPVEINE